MSEYDSYQEVCFPTNDTQRLFDPIWGIAPACFIGDHVGADNECIGEWHIDWYLEWFDRVVPDAPEEGWMTCRCRCHGFITEDMWQKTKKELLALRENLK